MVVRELITKMGFDIDSKKLKDLEASTKKVRNGLLGMVGVVAGAGGALFGLMKTAANTADGLNKVATSVGIGVEELQRFGYVASQSLSSVEEFGKGMQSLARGMDDVARNPTGNFAKAFVHLGVRAVDPITGKLRDSNTVFLELADAFKSMEDGAEKSALAMQIFGSAGGGLIATLNRGSQGIKEAAKEFDQLGGALSQKQIEDLNAFNDELAKLLVFLRNVKNQIAADLAPEMVAMIGEFKEFLIINKDLIQQNVGGFFKGLAGFMRGVFDVSMFLMRAFTSLAGGIGGAETATKLLLIGLMGVFGAKTLAGIAGMVKAIKGLGLVFTIAAAKPLLIGAAVAAVGYGIFKLFTSIRDYFNGSDNWIAAMANQFDKVAKYITGKMEKLRDLITKGFDFVTLGAFKGSGSGVGNNFLSTGSLSNITASNTPPASVTNSSQKQDINVNAPINVSVPQGTPPSMVGERVQRGISEGLSSILRRAGRVTSPNTAY